MPAVGFQKLVRRAQGGDRAAMDEVLENLRPHISDLARRYADPTKPIERTLGPGHPRTQRKRLALVGVLREGEQDEEVLAEYLRIAEASRSIRGRERFGWGSILEAAGIGLRDLGELKEADEMLRAAIDVFGRYYGPESERASRVPLLGD